MQSNGSDAIITYNESVDLISESSVQSRLDLGHSILYRLSHPDRGAIIVLNSASGACAVLAT